MKISAEKERAKTEAELYHDERKEVRLALKKKWFCEVHSQPDKPMLCYRDGVNNECYPITENNLNLWASFHVRIYFITCLKGAKSFQLADPENNPIDKKPAKVNILANGPHGRAPAQHANDQIAGPPTFPYNVYPSPYAFPNPWFPPGYQQLPVGYGATAAQPVIPQPTVPQSAIAQPSVPQPIANIPKIPEWLLYCDKHPEREGDNLAAYTTKFEKQGYRRINQLTDDNRIVLTEKLSDWLGIERGTIDLITRYAEEDIGLLKAGMFTMK